MSQPLQLQPLLTVPPARPAKGTAQGGKKRIVIALDDGRFDRIAMLAAASGVPFAEAVRQLLDRGLSSLIRRR